MAHQHGRRKLGMTKAEYERAVAKEMAAKRRKAARKKKPKGR